MQLWMRRCMSMSYLLNDGNYLLNIRSYLSNLKVYHQKGTFDLKGGDLNESPEIAAWRDAAI